MARPIPHADQARTRGRDHGTNVLRKRWSLLYCRGDQIPTRLGIHVKGKFATEKRARIDILSEEVHHLRLDKLPVPQRQFHAAKIKIFRANM